MASEASGLPQPVSGAGSTGAAIIARLDRIPIWSLSYLFIGIIGLIALAPLFPTLGPIVTFLILGGFLVVASVIAQFGTATRQKRLDEVSR
jgi:hypothetical protein